MKRPFLFLGILAAMAPAVFAQSNSIPKPVAVKFMTGETGVVSNADRPRVAPTSSAVSVNIKSVERIVFDLINEKRAQNGLGPLAWSDELEKVARLHSEDMAEFDYFSHRSPNGKMVSDRADDARVGKWRAIGENIAFNRGYSDPVTKAVELWLNSPSHKNNMMSGTWKESAIGVAIAADGSYYFTQVFLTRK